MEEVKYLSGNHELIPKSKNEYYRIKSGKVIIFLSKMDDKNQHGRKFYIDEVSFKDNIGIPAIYSDKDIEGKSWSIIISALTDAVIEVIKTNNIDDLCKLYGQRLSFKVDSQNELESELIESIERMMVTEEVRIYKNLEEERKINNNSLNQIYNFFYKNRVEKSDNTSSSALYNSVEFLCKKKNIDIVPYEKIIENCGRFFKLSDIARMSGFMIREVYLEKNWFNYEAGLILAYKIEEEDECIPVSCYREKKSYYEFDFQNNTSKKIDSKINEAYIKNAYMIYKPIPNKNMNFFGLIKFAIGTLKKRDIISISIMSFIVMLIQLIIPILYEYLFNVYIPMGFKGALIQLGIVSLAIGISNIFFIIYKGLVQFKITTCMEFDLQNAIFHRLFNLNGNAYREFECADLVRRAMSITGIVRSITSCILSSFLPLILSLVYIAFMNRCSSAYTKIGMLYVLIEFMIIAFLGFKQVKYSNRLVESKTDASSYLYQLLSGIEKIRISGREDVASLKYYERYIKIRGILKNQFKYKNIGNCIRIFMASSFMVLIFSQSILSSNLKVGTLVSFLSIYGMFSNSILQICDGLINVGELYPEIKRNKIFFSDIEEQNCFGDVSKVSGEIEVSNVYFSYSSPEENILKNLSIKIEKGEYIGIVGGSGSGKSTLLKLLLGFYKPSSGKIYYDNKDIDVLDKRELRRKLGVVLQNGELIAGSIYDNIAITSSEVTRDEAKSQFERVKEVIKYVGLEEDIKSMPMGLQTIISEGGGGISGGQKQRILVARAIFNNPNILIFDEATSALDNVSQQILCDNLEKLNITRIVVAHRLSTVKKCDRIYVLNNGEIQEVGSYDELIEKKGFFYDLVKRQIA